ncbi:hypothetical protein CGJ66_24360 [Vibrio parahaemolyticus]|uniref:hypothetical protein n=1 Tax=Vibrio parahaemolyticus TaxID=670 RepID=UPI00111F11E2|nr:hypothetical protein [Vibrio parahaemolyticus]TOD28809.1 hypothetical protein CGJ66_24360 [Vibrio parahaemolyticus]
MEKNRKHRILFAYHSKTWRYGHNDKEQLESMSERVIPEEYEPEMQGKIFCPRCATPLSRTPSDKSVTTNNVTAFYKHGSSKKYPEPCLLRVSKPKGLKYVNEEEVKKAIESKDLIVVSGWKEEPPTGDDDLDVQGEYTKTAVEDSQGPETQVPIGRHNGKEYSVPSNLSTVMALCKDFPNNLKKGFYFPNSKYPMLLSDQLYATTKLSNDLTKKETLFFGKITEYRTLNFRHVIEIESGDYYFKIYTKPEHDKRKRLDATSVGRYLLFSTIPYWEVENSVLAAKIDLWGAYSVLPRKYDKYIRLLEY